MSDVEHIWRQHRGWRNSKGRKFFEKKARQIRTYIEESPIINQPSKPLMRRMFIVTYWDVPKGKEARIAYGVRRGMIYIRGRKAVPEHGVYISHERVWNVCDHMWNRLILAQAERDGRNYHYARHLMTDGTPAARL